eukprot:scaffold6127_cov267-Pinguiococcus_pyrenoidosus.AAC.1
METRSRLSTRKTAGVNRISLAKPSSCSHRCCSVAKVCAASARGSLSPKQARSIVAYTCSRAIVFFNASASHRKVDPSGKRRSQHFLCRTSDCLFQRISFPSQSRPERKEKEPHFLCRRSRRVARESYRWYPENAAGKDSASRAMPACIATMPLA